MAKVAIFRPNPSDKFIVRVLNVGDEFGGGAKGKHAEQELVEFYDGNVGTEKVDATNAAHEGQFTGARYTVQSLLTSSGPVRLHADKKNWAIDDVTMNEIRTWLGVLTHEELAS